MQVLIVTRHWAPAKVGKVVSAVIKIDDVYKGDHPEWPLQEAQDRAARHKQEFCGKFPEFNFAEWEWTQVVDLIQ